MDTNTNFENKKETKMETTLEKIYPNHEIVGAQEVFVAGAGWIGVACTRKEDALSFRYSNSPMGKIEKVCLVLKNKCGAIKYADFAPNEY